MSINLKGNVRFGDYTELSLDSLVSSHVYEIVKTIYSTTAPSTDESTRISVLQSTLGQLRLANIATLDALMTHFTRLIDLTSADEAYVSALATNLAPCILRPKHESSLTMDERFSYRLIRDLFAHKEAIFGELKRASAVHALGHTPSATDPNRQRAISTDESNRRAHMEERQRAIANQRSRSPAPAARSSTPGMAQHRRDRSTDGRGHEGRFPINTSPTDVRGRSRTSLEVPGSAGLGPAKEAPSTAGATAGDAASASATTQPNGTVPAAATNGTAVASASVGGAEAGKPDSPPDTASPVTPSTAGASADGVEKKNSMGRSGGVQPRFPRKPAGGLQRQSLTKESMVGNRDSVGSLGDGSTAAAGSERGSLDEKRGVELVDKPMDF